MSRVDDIDLTHDATAEQIFGFDLMTLELGRLAEETTERAPRGHRRHRILVCLWIVLSQEHQTVALNDELLRVGACQVAPAALDGRA